MPSKGHVELLDNLISLTQRGSGNIRVILFALGQHEPWLYCECGGSGLSGESFSARL